MNGTFLKLSNKIKFNITNSFKDAIITNATLDADSKKFKINLEINQKLETLELELFLDCLENNFEYKSEIFINHKNPDFSKEHLLDYFFWVSKKYFNLHDLNIFIHDHNVFLKDNVLEIKINQENIYKKVEEINSKVNLMINNFGFNNFKISLIKDFDNFDKSILETNQAQNSLMVKNFVFPTSIEQKKETKNFKSNFKQKDNLYIECKIVDLKHGGLNRVSFKANIFKHEIKETKNGFFILELQVIDYEEGILCKRVFKDHDKAKKLLEKALEQDGNVIIEGSYQMDNYKKTMFINIDNLMPTKSFIEKRSDDASEKRVELSLRTKMSAMDGVLGVETLMRRLKEMNHDTVAVVDKNSVQFFPEIYHLAKKNNIKPIYGATIDVINQDINAIWNWKKNLVLEDDTYVVFDIETTGLSPIFEDIIEFGAIKVQNGQLKEQLQFFVKPEKKISSEITQLTNITQKDVENGISEKEAILKIVEFFNDHTLVAHNANFDMNFIYEKLFKYGFSKINNPVIDTLKIAHILHPDEKKFRLESFVKRLGVWYSREEAHRADYDANVLAQAWIHALLFLKRKEIVTQKDLFEYKTNDLYNHSFSSEISVLTKNQDGLKELFKIISKSSTENFFKNPKYFIEDLEKNKNLLYGSGAIKSRLFEKVFFGKTEDIIKEISFYDYIEVQPPKNFSHLINENFTVKNLEKILKFIILEAKKQGKIVVATGDVRYFDKREQVFHKVYVYAKSIGGKRHYLYKRNNKKQEIPFQHFLTTEEMKKEFLFLEDANLIEEIVVDNTNLIASQIDDNIQVIKDKLYTPVFENDSKKLENIVYENAHKMYGNPLPEIVAKRLDKELVPIKKYGFSVVYWISHLLVKKSLEDGYLVGSRGSVGSSLVATMAKITEVNPLPAHYYCQKCQYSDFSLSKEYDSGYDLPNKQCQNCEIDLLREGQNIPFETFLGFEANKIPDIDLNFSGDYQQIIHEEVKKIFGDKYSFRAGTISTVADKTAYGYVKAFEEEEEIEYSDVFREYIVQNVVGTKRTTGQHPGGIIVIPNNFEVEDFSPINYPANDVNAAWKTTHFDFHAIHDNVLKLDLLGHDDPTAIRHLEKLTNINAKKDIPMYDPKIISLFSSPEHLGVSKEDIDGEETGVMGIPEFGTQFVRKMLKSVEVKSFADLISISGLSHGTDVWTNNAQTLVKEKNLSLKEVISCRDDIMIDLIKYDVEPLKAFEIMEQARKGKSINQEQEKLLIQKGVPIWYIESIKKIKYMFPKAHATAYVIMAWRIAWFKLYKPLAYYATYFSTRADVSDVVSLVNGKNQVLSRLSDLKSRRNIKTKENKLSNKEQALIPILEIANEAYARGIKLSVVNLERSHSHEWVIDEENNTIIAPFIAIDGLGETIANAIIKEREIRPFNSINDLVQRTSINKTVLETMVSLGILKNLDKTEQISLDF